MRVPILTNARTVVCSWKTGEPVEPEVRFAGYGPDLDLTALAQLVEQLTALTGRLKQDEKGRREFDQCAARLLGEKLPLPPSVAADKRFWQWFAITQAESVVLWRWKKTDRAKVKAQHWLGGWKDTFRRLWLRATLIHEPTASDPFELAGYGHEDFWVGIIERDIAGCRLLVRTLVHSFFLAGDGAARSEKLMLHYRGTLKRLRQIRPGRVYEQMTADEVDALVREAMAATLPADGPATPPARRKKRKNAAGRIRAGA